MVRDEAVYRPVTAPKPPPDRITLGYAPILAAREVWVLASGESKKDAFRRLRGGEESLPIARVVSGRGLTRIFEDIEPL
jgi:6-phosphogluconolactonase